MNVNVTTTCPATANLTFVTTTLVAWAIGFLTGCGNGNLPEMGTVSGIVTLDGKPVKDAVVRFQPSNGRGSRAKTDADGVYELGYVGSGEGALIGDHHVTITTQWMDEDRKTHKIVSHPETLPARYNSKSDLNRTVVAGHNEINFELTSK
jgi:hypothetical protein